MKLYIKIILGVIFVIILGMAGAFLFQALIFPWMLSDSSFERLGFIEDFKNGKVIVNPTQQIYIQENTTLQDAIQKVEKSVVTIQGKTSEGDVFLRTGLVATSDGYIVTLASAIPAGSFNVFAEGQSVVFKIQKVDYDNNLALIKVEKTGLASVGFANLSNIKIGQRVFLTSSTLIDQSNWFANEGIIREIDKDSIKTNIQERAIINGGPLFNISGELVGLSFVDSEGKISAIPIDKIKSILGI